MPHSRHHTHACCGKAERTSIPGKGVTSDPVAMRMFFVFTVSTDPSCFFTCTSFGFAMEPWPSTLVTYKHTGCCSYWEHIPTCDTFFTCTLMQPNKSWKHSRAPLAKLGKNFRCSLVINCRQTLFCLKRWAIPPVKAFTAVVFCSMNLSKFNRKLSTATCKGWCQNSKGALRIQRNTVAWEDVARGHLSQLVNGFRKNTQLISKVVPQRVSLTRKERRAKNREVSFETIMVTVTGAWYIFSFGSFPKGDNTCVPAVSSKEHPKEFQTFLPILYFSCLSAPSFVPVNLHGPLHSFEQCHSWNMFASRCWSVQKSTHILFLCWLSHCVWPCGRDVSCVAELWMVCSPRWDKCLPVSDSSPHTPSVKQSKAVKFYLNQWDNTQHQFVQWIAKSCS